MEGSTCGSHVVNDEYVLACKYVGIGYAENVFSVSPSLRTAFMCLCVSIFHSLDAMCMYGDACSFAHTLRYVVALVVAALAALLLGSGIRRHRASCC
jgi:hypothetical protein